MPASQAQSCGARASRRAQRMTRQSGSRDRRRRERGQKSASIRCWCDGPRRVPRESGAAHPGRRGHGRRPARRQGGARRRPSGAVAVRPVALREPRRREARPRARRASGSAPRAASAIDVGASTGGFTDCLLAAGATRVFAVDVGHGQLDAKLRADARVVVMEQTNARALDPRVLRRAALDLATVDVSFISLEKVLPAVFNVLARGVRSSPWSSRSSRSGKGHVGKGGRGPRPRHHRAVVQRRRPLRGAARLARAGRDRLAARGAQGQPRVLPASGRPRAAPPPTSRPHRADGGGGACVNRSGIVAKPDATEAHASSGSCSSGCAARG